MTPGMPDQGDGKFGLILGKVVEIHPEHNAVDVAVFYDGRRLVAVPVVGDALTGNTGTVDLAIPDLTTDRHDQSQDGKWVSNDTDKRDIIAVVGFVEGAPICLGFLSPPVCELHFPDNEYDEFRIQRHASDLYETIDRDANHEWYHPSGTFLRVAEDPEHLDLTGKDYDKKWAIKRNTDKAPHVHLVVANAGSVMADVHIDPDGNVSVTSQGNIVATADKAISLTALEGVTITAPSINLNSPDVQIQGVSRGESGMVF